MKSTETVMLQTVWRRAYQAGEAGLEIGFKTKAGAVRARMQLYNAVKAQKAGKDMEDLELVHAAEEIEIVWTGEKSIKLQRRDKSDMIQSIAAALGQAPDQFVDPAALESLRRMMEVQAQIKGEAEAGADGFTHQENPFYGKRKL